MSSNTSLAHTDGDATVDTDICARLTRTSVAADRETAPHTSPSGVPNNASGGSNSSVLFAGDLCMQRPTQTLFCFRK
jgi:hypothetical protein